MLVAGENAVITVMERTHLLIMLYKYSMEGDFLPIVALLISAGAEQCC